ncbi:MAG TPA: DUF6036 family nucleotidyltransferase [Bacillales bacterium]|nr:DUF6036 family nucleotidyltransferase [Bacillales bacterium]
MISIEEVKQLIQKEKSGDKFQSLLFTASLLTEVFEGIGLKPVVVGGFAVEIYTRNHYTTYDIDFVMSGYEQAGEILQKLGFIKEGRTWYHEKLDTVIEIPDNFLAGDEQKVANVEVRNGMKINVIGIEDLIIDRLQACVHWKSGEDCEWAERLFVTHEERLDLDYLKKQAKENDVEGQLEIWFS